MSANTGALRAGPSTGRATVIGDVFGQVVAVCHARGGLPGHAFEVSERDDGHQSSIDAAVYFADLAATTPALRTVLAHADGRVLDVGCAAGSRARWLQRRGMDVVGLEESPGAAAVARNRGVAVVEGSLQDPPAGLGRFDTFLLLGGGLSRLGNPEQARRMLAALAWHARPGAQILGDCAEPVPSGSADRAPGRVRVRLRDGAVVSEWHDRWLLTPDELLGVLDGTGWRLADLWPNDSGYAVRLRRRPPRAEVLAPTAPVPVAMTRWRI
ncbi:SAM-dependent methyltransferase [Allocatelliglobosispora scoriae]|uniref:SAM-dependent methyltransferase n=1 Tax=Allocatelliglobosispora scoriae TaxID=643052 RepID=A0A841BP17_9ACTN|nr:class I SAM-dependent methyltransferase [Allocatelliglobosispora scoriae]MBB5868939.1 SAM-dependent methyltransferase [Allocatelliglobosispora scoriae]